MTAIVKGRQHKMCISLLTPRLFFILILNFKIPFNIAVCIQYHYVKTLMVFEEYIVNMSSLFFVKYLLFFKENY